MPYQMKPGDVIPAELIPDRATLEAIRWVVKNRMGFKVNDEWGQWDDKDQSYGCLRLDADGDLMWDIHGNGFDPGRRLTLADLGIYPGGWIVQTEEARTGLVDTHERWIPVPNVTPIEVEYRDGYVWATRAGNLHAGRWIITGDDDDIMRWRFRFPTEEEEKVEGKEQETMGASDKHARRSWRRSDMINEQNYTPSQMLRFVADAMERGDDPKEVFDTTSGGRVDSWIITISLAVRGYLRLRPRTINIGGVEVPEPMRMRPPVGVGYWLVSLNNKNGSPEPAEWEETPVEYCWLRRGLCHRTREAAEKHIRALILASGGEVDND